MVVNIFTTTCKLYCIVFQRKISSWKIYYLCYDYSDINQEKDNGLSKYLLSLVNCIVYYSKKNHLLGKFIICVMIIQT